MSFTTGWRKRCVKVEQKTSLGARNKVCVEDTSDLFEAPVLLILPLLIFVGLLFTSATANDLHMKCI